MPEDTIQPIQPPSPDTASQRGIPDPAAYIRQLGEQARDAARALGRADRARKNHALRHIAAQIAAQEAGILAANEMDLAAARKANLSSALYDRLALNPARIALMAESCRQVARLPDPVGRTSRARKRPNGLEIARMRVPLGVIGIIYESRPNVTVDAAVLCLKAGNAVILRGGSEALHSNLALARCLAAGLSEADLPVEAVQLVATPDRAAVDALLQLDDYIDVIIPRGGRALNERVSAVARVPVIKHLDGICHVYLDTAADAEKAHRVALNAKTRRYGICGAMETLLVARSRAAELLPPLGEAFTAAGVALRGCAETRALIPQASAAAEQDWRTEYLDAVLAIRIVAGLDEAIQHINQYGSRHTDAIVSEDTSAQQRFLREVDSSSVMVNASTQFADGYEYGLGAEIGISTGKLHARGPVGLEGLTCEKYIVFGDGAVRA